MRVEPVEFQVEEEVVLLRHVPGQGARPDLRPATGSLLTRGRPRTDRGDRQHQRQRKADGPDEPGRMAPA